MRGMSAMGLGLQGSGRLGRARCSSAPAPQRVGARLALVSQLPTDNFVSQVPRCADEHTALDSDAIGTGASGYWATPIPQARQTPQSPGSSAAHPTTHPPTRPVFL